MLIDATDSDYIHRVNGVPLFYSGLDTRNHSHATLPYNDLLMASKFVRTESENLLSITLTPPLSPNSNFASAYQPLSTSRRASVIMKVENFQIVPINESQPINMIAIDHVCRWENCYKFFDSLEKLANHVSIFHSSVASDNLYYCKWEGCIRTTRGFNARYKMLVHARTHTKEKPHKCTFYDCGKSFSRAENLKIHIRSHTLEKPYRCNFPGCIKAYSNSSDRFKHSRTHQNNKPYCCKVPHCGKRYTDPSSLRKHVKTFNHEILIPQFNNECDNAPKIIDEKAIYCEKVEHLETSKEEIYFDQWSNVDHQHKELTVKIETINLNEPLDLSIRHTR